MPAALKEAPRPTWQNREEMNKDIETQYGKDVLDTLRTSTQLQKSVVQDLEAKGLNGQAKELEHKYLAHEQEFARADKVNETWLQKGWRVTKETVKEGARLAAVPFRYAWETAKKHPVLATLAVAALAVGGVALTAYMTGNLELLLSTVGLSHLYGKEGAAKAAEELGKVLDGSTPLPDYFRTPVAPDLK